MGLTFPLKRLFGTSENFQLVIGVRLKLYRLANITTFAALLHTLTLQLTSRMLPNRNREFLTFAIVSQVSIVCREECCQI